jgi:radical SAM protein with 4Fe4S-binding SPASM domain
MPTNLLKRLLQEAAKEGVTAVRFTGGEPLLRDDFLEIYCIAHELKLRISLCTNATFMTKEIARILRDKPPQKITISFYGWNKLSYEKITRVSASFDSFIMGLSNLKEFGIFFHATAPPIRQLLLYHKDIKSLAHSFGGVLDRNQEWFLILSAHRDVETSKIICDIRLTPKEMIPYVLGNKERLKTYQQKLRQVLSRQKNVQLLFRCGAGLDRAAINAYGRLQLCLDLRHPDTLYDLNEGTLRDAIVNFIPSIRRMRMINADYLSRCAKCPIKPICYQCPATSWSENGTMDSPSEYFCAITKVKEEILANYHPKEDAKNEYDSSDSRVHCCKCDPNMVGHFLVDQRT